MASARPPLVIPVEKKGRFSENYALRFLCFDPNTRMAYLSDKGTKVRFWKHQMKLYAVVPKMFEHKDGSGSITSCGSVAIDFRKESFDANELLTFVMHGVSHHKLDSREPADLALMEHLPNLLQLTFEDNGNVSTVSTQAADAPLQHSKEEGGGGGAHYHAGESVGTHSDRPVSIEEDRSFFGKDRTVWQLRCPYFNLWEEVMNLMRDALIADGLLFPLHGNFPGYRDPRNGLQLTTIPMWLAKPFQLLTNAIVYSCIHGRMVGCSPQGPIGICMRHCYVCITDQDVLFMSESGQAVRWMPIRKVEKLEYSLGGGGSGGDQQPYCSFVARDGLADVLLLPCDPFTKSTASASMVDTMPRCDPAQEIQNIAYLLGKLATTTTTTTQERAEAEEADADIDLGDLDGGGGEDAFDPDLQVLADNVKTVPMSGTGKSFDAAAVRPDSLTVEQYCDAFAASHGRAFNWQPLPGTHQETPSVLQSHVLAQRLRIPQPERQDVTLRPEFRHFYFPDGDPRNRSAGDSSTSGHERRHGSGQQHQQREGGDNAGTVDELYQSSVPVKRGSKLLNVLSPDKRLFLV